MKSLSLGKKLGLLLSFLLGILTLVGGVGTYNSNRLGKDLELVANVELPLVRTMTLMDMMDDGIRGTVFRALLQAKGNDSVKKEVRDEFSEMKANFETHLKTIDALPLPDATRNLVDASKQPIERYLKSSERMIDATLSNQEGQIPMLLTDFENQFTLLETELGKLGDQVEKDAQHESEVALQHAKLAQILVLMTLGIGIILGAGFGIALIRNTTSHMNRLIEDLTHQAKSVRGSSTDIQEGSTRLSEAVTEQAASLQETAASLDEIRSTMGTASDNSEKARVVAKESLDNATKGKASMEEMTASIQRISDSNDRIMQEVADGNKKLLDIIQVINEIAEKTKVINDIVFQTKLLSFNASVEAARAGEHGKGFAVVAEEVGNLAQMSGNAAKEIRDMVEVSVKQVEQIIRTSKENVEKIIDDGKGTVEEGVKVAQSCQEILTSAADKAVQVSSTIDLITTAVIEQSKGVNEIAMAMNQLDTVTNKNSTASQKSAEQANLLATHATDLFAAVGRLRQTIHGGGRTDATQDTPPEGPTAEQASDTKTDYQRAA